MNTDIEVTIWDVTYIVSVDDFIMDKTKFIKHIERAVSGYIIKQNEEMENNLDYNFK